ncbi:MAG: hypothetical protein WCK84_06740 [Bacteroidota bacterium]
MKKGKKVVGKNKRENSFSTGKAGLAVKHGFYLETAWILSSIFEKKTKSFLRRIESASNLKAYSFEQTIKRLKYHHQGGRVPLLEKYLDLALIEEMRNWKNSRNTMLKDMVNVHVSRNRMERLALEGIVLYKKWNKSLKQVKAEMKNETKVN